jgi:hypothetical protein
VISKKKKKKREGEIPLGRADSMQQTISGEIPIFSEFPWMTESRAKNGYGTVADDFLLQSRKFFLKCHGLETSERSTESQIQLGASIDGESLVQIQIPQGVEGGVNVSKSEERRQTGIISFKVLQFSLGECIVR